MRNFFFVTKMLPRCHYILAPRENSPLGPPRADADRSNLFFREILRVITNSFDEQYVSLYDLDEIFSLGFFMMVFVYVVNF